LLLRQPQGGGGGKKNRRPGRGNRGLPRALTQRGGKGIRADGKEDSTVKTSSKRRDIVVGDEERDQEGRPWRRGKKRKMTRGSPDVSKKGLAGQ